MNTSSASPSGNQAIHFWRKTGWLEVENGGGEIRIQRGLRAEKFY